MKKIKNYTIALGATLAIVASGITLLSAGLKTKKMFAPQWYVFTGDPNNNSELQDPSMYQPYVPTITNPEPSCVEGFSLCAIKVEPNSLNSSIPEEENLIEVLERNEGDSPNRSEIKHHSEN